MTLVLGQWFVNFLNDGPSVAVSNDLVIAIAPPIDNAGYHVPTIQLAEQLQLLIDSPQEPRTPGAGPGRHAQ
jgi:hypothetical protein